MKRSYFSALLILVVGSTVGCGYSSKSLLPAGATSIAIEIFENDTFYREIEFDLTREIASEFRRRTHYSIASRSRADLIMTGRIVDVRRPTLVESDNDFVSEQGVIVSAEVVLTDPRTGLIVETFRASRRTEFVVERGENLNSAFAEVVEELAERIVDLLESGSFRESLQGLRAGDENS
ncbi:MAG: LPS assembly lipoprotein LptE [Planctomycetota bacterium]